MPSQEVRPQVFSPFAGWSDISFDAVDPAGDAWDENRIRPHFKERRQKYSPGCDSSLSRENTLRLFPAEKSENLKQQPTEPAASAQVTGESSLPEDKDEVPRKLDS